MNKKVIVSVIIFCIFLAVAGCSSPAAATTRDTTPATDTTPPAIPTPPGGPSSVVPSPPPSGPIKATWIDAILEGDIVSVELAEVEENWNNNFKIEAKGETLNFMAYIVDEELFVRANVCPPCKSIGFSLDDDILVCDRCATTFEAVTGDGIEGACVDFPKASVEYEISGGNMVMKLNDLVAAYEDTIKPG